MDVNCIGMDSIILYQSTKKSKRYDIQYRQNYRCSSFHQTDTRDAEVMQCIACASRGQSLLLERSAELRKMATAGCGVNVSGLVNSGKERDCGKKKIFSHLTLRD